jgi:hypothetical protein
MKKNSSKTSHAAKGSGFNLSSQTGSLLITLAVTFLILSAFSVAVVSFISTDTSQSVVENRGLNAYYLAESGYRIAGSMYLRTPNEDFSSDSFSADDDKAEALSENIDQYRFNLPDGQGAFHLEVYPYWFMRTGGVFQFPGHKPVNFSLPTSGFLKRGEDHGNVGFITYTNASISGNTLTLTPVPSAQNGDRLYVTLRPTGNQTATVDANLVLNNPTGAQGFVPAKNGLINIDNNTNRFMFTYNRAEFSGTSITLKGLKEAAGSFGNSVNVTSSTNVVFKKFIVLRSRGEVGQPTDPLTFSQQSVDFFTPISDALQEDPPLVYTLQSQSDFNNNWTNNEGNSLEIGTYNTAGGGTNVYASLKSVISRDSNRYGYGSICLNKASDFSTKWKKNQHFLDYDVQVKIGTGNRLMQGAAGITLRNNTAGRIGVSFIKYYYPFIPYLAAGRTTALKDGDIITGRTSGATAIVVGDPLLFRGTWLGGNAQGEVRVKNVTGVFGYTEQLKVGTETTSYIQMYNDDTYGVNFRDATYNDLIPDEIKPPKAGVSEGHGQEILIVLWEEKGQRSAVTQRRWLAYKVVSLDRYVIGDQDYNDGNIVNDDATLLVRIREGYDSATGTPVKVNRINVFYGDKTPFVLPTSRVGDNISYNIEHQRQKYARETQDNYPTVSAFTPRWPPRLIDNWAGTFDFFSHIEDQEIQIYNNIDYDCDWIVNTTASSGYDANQSSFIFKKDADGTIVLSDYVTPISGNNLTNSSSTYSYPTGESDVCLHGYGRVSYAPFAVIGFNEFALRFFYSGHVFGGFMPSVQE